MARGIRTLFLTHRYLGIGLCLLFIIWFVSGIAMLYVRMPILYPAERFALLEPIPLDAVAVQPAAAARALDPAADARRIRVGTLEGRAVYHVLMPNKPWQTVYADSGEPAGRVDPAMAERMTARITGAPSPRFMETVESIDQWTLTNSLNQHRPLHRIALDDEAGTEVYVSSWTGEIVMRTTARGRMLAWIGPIAHWGAPEILRNQVGAWRQTMIWLSTAGVALAISGIWIGLRRFRWRGYRFADGAVSRVPYQGLKKWHQWSGLAFGLVTLTWMVSGLFYLNPGGSRATPLDTTTTMSPYSVGGIRSSTSTLPGQSEAFAGGRFDPSRISVSPRDAWARVGRDATIREVEVNVFDGRPRYTFFADPVTSWTIPADRPDPVARVRFDTDALIAAAGRAVPGAAMREATLLHGYDAYWYSVGAVAPKRMPVLRVKFDDAASTWFYIDPHTGTILRRYDTYGRLMRWVINGLHTLDFPFLMFNRPAWDLTIILLSLGGIALSGSGLWMGWRRYPGRSRRLPHAPRRLAWGLRTTMIVILAVLALIFGASLAQAQGTSTTDSDQQTIPTLHEEVVVTGSLSREPVSSLATTVQVIDEQTIERSTATTVTDLLADLGVAFMGKWTPAQTSVNLRGGSNDPQGRDFRSQVVVLINGRRAGTSNLSKLSVADLRRVEVLRGASSLLYGSQAIGGVINLILKDGLTSPGTDVELTGGSFGLVNGNAGWGAAFGKLDVRLTVQAARSGDYTSGAGSVEVPVANTSWNQRGAGVSVGYTRSDRERFSAQLRSDGMHDVGFRGSAWDIDNFENRQNQSFDASYQRTSLNDRWTLAFSGYAFRDTDDFHWGSEIVRNGNLAAPGFDTDDNERVQDGRGLKGSVALQPGHGNTTWVGTDADWTVLRSTRVRTPVPGGATSQIAPFDNNNDTRNTGLFAETAQRLVGERLVLRGGLRHDRAHLSMKSTPNFPTLAPREETTGATTYRAGVVVQVVPKAQTIAYWHHPLFTSGPDGDSPRMRDFWRILYDAGAEIIMTGHEHLYERFAPQSPDGAADPVRGIRQFIVGTGGAFLYQPVAIRANSDVRISTFGVLKLTLSADRYDWEFVSVTGPRDSGSGSCH